jgi:hypothetical protein
MKGRSAGSFEKSEKNIPHFLRITFFKMDQSTDEGDSVKSGDCQILLLSKITVA